MEKEVIKFILRKLIKMRKIGGSHTDLKNITKGMPIEFTSTNKGQKIIKKAIKELINKEFLLQKPSTGELHVSINPRKFKDVIEFIEKN